MKKEDLVLLLPTLTLISLLIISFFLNYLLAIYSEDNLFKTDLTKSKKNKKIRKLIFILKNNQLFYIIISFSQVIINMLISTFLATDRWYDWWIFEKFGKFTFIVIIAFFIALITEILSRYLGSKPFSKKLIYNNFFLEITYALIRLPPFLRRIIKPKKKIFANSERDVIRFINNLAAEGILEKKEALLVQSAFNFDELRVNSVLTPWKKVVFLSEEMSYEEIQKIHLNNFHTRYPVLNRKKEVIGVFSWEKFYWSLIKNQNNIWKEQIDQKIIVVSPNDKLNEAFEKLQKNYCHLAIVSHRKSLLGIVTLQNIINSLVGKMRDEKDKLLPSRL